MPGVPKVSSQEDNILKTHVFFMDSEFSRLAISQASKGRLRHPPRGISQMLLGTSQSDPALLHTFFQKLFWCRLCRGTTPAFCSICSNHQIIKCVALPTGWNVGNRKTLSVCFKISFPQLYHGAWDYIPNALQGPRGNEYLQIC